MKRENMPWKQLINEFPEPNKIGRVSSLFGFSYIPYYILLDKEGKVLLPTLDEKATTDEIEQVIR